MNFDRNAVQRGKHSPACTDAWFEIHTTQGGNHSPAFMDLVYFKVV